MSAISAIVGTMNTSNIESLMEHLPDLPIKCKAKCRFGMEDGFLTTNADIEIYDGEELIGILYLYDNDENREIKVSCREENDEYRPILNLIANYLQDELEIDFMADEVDELLADGPFEYEFTLEHPYIG